MRKIHLFTLLFIVSILIMGQSEACLANDGRLAYQADGTKTVTAIASAYGWEGELVAAMNNLDPSDKPQGQIYLPLEPQQTITVNKGDTLWDLAQSHCTTVAALIDSNKLKNPRLLKVGQELCVPVANLSEPTEIIIKTLPVTTVLASRSSSDFIWPLKGLITSVFGPRGDGFHHGLDIADDTGSTIIAAAGGKVEFAAWHSNIYGKMVIIKNDEQTQTYYAHCSDIFVKKGQTVQQGDAIAAVGETGKSTGPHLHFQININDKPVDPQHYLP